MLTYYIPYSVYQILYNPLCKTLIYKNMKKMNLLKLVGLSYGTLAKLWKDKSVSLSVIDKICIDLNYNISNTVKIKKSRFLSCSP